MGLNVASRCFVGLSNDSYCVLKRMGNVRNIKQTGYMFFKTWNHLHVRLLSLHGLFMLTVKIMCIYLAVFIFFSYLVCIKCIYNRHRRTFVTSLKHVMNASSSRETNGADIRALIVTAHPDDECMFFAPTIIRLVELNASVHLLCLSQGTAIARSA